MSQFRRDRLTLDQALYITGVLSAPHIKFDPDVRPQYRIIRQSAHDGTLLFTNQLVQRAIVPLLACTSYFRPESPEPGMIPTYTVGRIKLATVFGMVDLPAGRFPGQRERISVPVRVEWSFPPK